MIFNFDQRYCHECRTEYDKAGQVPGFAMCPTCFGAYTLSHAGKLWLAYQLRTDYPWGRDAAFAMLAIREEPK